MNEMVNDGHKGFIMYFRKLMHPAPMSLSVSLSFKQYVAMETITKMIQLGLKSSMPSTEWLLLSGPILAYSETLCLKY